MRSPDFLKKLTGDSLKSAKTKEKHSAAKLNNRKFKEDDKSNHSSDLDISMSTNGRVPGPGSISQGPRLRQKKTIIEKS